VAGVMRLGERERFTGWLLQCQRGSGDGRALG
jgi:hypothetical protein